VHIGLLTISLICFEQDDSLELSAMGRENCLTAYNDSRTEWDVYVYLSLVREYDTLTNCGISINFLIEMLL
jgi:hypothetical protein